MKRAIISLLVGAAFLGVSWAAYQSVAVEEPSLSRFAPSGALLYLQAKDFASLLADWNDSREQQLWLKSANYEVFSRSRLFLRLKGGERRRLVGRFRRVIRFLGGRRTSH